MRPRYANIFGSFIYIYLIAKLVGPDNKLAWFRKRKNTPSLIAVVFSVRISTSVILYAGKAFWFSWQFTA